jgi:molecular chaperone DnaK (HSP70)
MPTYGIDLGTTNSCIAYVDDTGRPVVLKSAVGEDTTPSVVYFESPDNVVVGRQAKDSAVLVPDLVVELVKRQMGEDAHYRYHGQDHTPESVSALILRELARAAGEQTGETVHDVVITVPAYFGVLEREATRKAGRIAGLNVLDVVAEPVPPRWPTTVGQGRSPAHLRLRPWRRDVRHHGYPAGRRQRACCVHRR